MKRSRSIGIYIAVLVLLLLVASVLFSMRGTQSTTKYYEILGYFYRGEVEGYELDLGTGDMVMTVKGQTKEIVYRVPNVSVFLQDTEQLVADYNK